MGTVDHHRNFAGQQRFARVARAAALIAALAVSAGHARCLPDFECSGGDIGCDLPSFLFLYAALTACPSTAFTTAQGGAGVESVRFAVQTANFEYVAVGVADQSFGTPINAHSGGEDIWVARYDQNGNRLWLTFFGSAGTDNGTHVSELADGSLLISGFAAGSFGAPINPHNGASDMAILKLDANGNLIWNTFHGSAAGDAGGKTVVRDDGLIWYIGVAGGDLLGNAGPPLAAFNAVATMGVGLLIDADGQPQLNGLLGPGPGGSAEYRGSTAVPNGIVAFGFSTADVQTPVVAHSGGGNDWYAQVITNDASPQLGFSTHFVTTGPDEGQEVTLLSSNELLAVGRSANSTGTPLNAFAGGQEMIVAKLDLSGNGVFHTYFGSAGADRARGVAQLLDGTVIVSGRSDASWGTPTLAHNGGNDLALVRITSDGALLSNRFYGAAGDDDGFSVQPTCDGGMVVGGSIGGDLSTPGPGTTLSGFSGGTEDGVLMKFAPADL